MSVILSALLCTVLFPIDSIALQFLWDLVFGKGGRVPRVRHIDNSRSFNTHAILDFIGLIERHGYSGEEHCITTQDGYILTLHRISGSPKIQKSRLKPVVYLQHGILASSDTFVLMGPTNDLGETFYHEIAIYDVANSIDYILHETGQRSLTYIGHSMGTTISFVLLSVRPEYNDKINLNICLSPIAYWKSTPLSFYHLLKRHGSFIERLLLASQINELFPLTEASILLGRFACSERSVLQPICISLFLELSGQDKEQLNTKYLPYIFSYFPAGTSAKILMHYHQNIMSGEFQAFNYSAERNYWHYGTEEPPHYNLRKIRAPVAIFFGDGDILSTKKMFHKDVGYYSSLPQGKPETEVSGYVVLMYTLYDAYVTEQIGRILNEDNIHNIFKPPAKIGQLLNNPEDKKAPLSDPGVYKIPCSCGRLYIGETGRAMSQRVKEDESKVRLKYFTQSALAEHYREIGHTIYLTKQPPSQKDTISFQGNLEK
ncbi:lipase 3-like [Belonocnema kinseyi]|uniref:lipase 3-like n=1 Tax=Belonocnema kinseyi TaxID=2817044 RepID=UPI00143DBFE5|nr:lipase 3-like [Belonocnema kinseyi]